MELQGRKIHNLEVGIFLLITDRKIVKKKIQKTK